ncbi:hypothetical protein PG993_010099 [Apiospora rasikravindrae]|uniref:C2H2-type domain-containing protein n=1 Tax=Apiospora rasikravindrae TaxID=990691 RepID=A0ABR1SN10_9PEZI
MNPKQHSTCATKTFLTISSLGQHLRLAHSPKGRHYCKACCQFFQSASALKAHADSGVCRPTGGVSVDELPKMSHKHERPASKWNTVWQQLFPHLKRPRSPYPDGNHEIDQFVQFFLRALQRPMPGLMSHDRESIATLLQCQASRWRTEPGEPLDHALLTGPLTKTDGMLFSRSLRPSNQLAAIDSAMA